MLGLAVAFGASFVVVALRAWQQRNVMAARYGAMFGTSILYAFAEGALVLAYVAHNGFHIPTLLAIGVGAGSGGCVAVYLSKRVFHD